MKRLRNWVAGIAPALVMATIVLAGCEQGTGDSVASPGGSSGSGGSMARFTIAGDFLYTVSDTELSIVSLVSPTHPTEVEKLHVGVQIETIFAREDLLFIGSQGAMYIYDITRPEFPKLVSTTSHLKSCDPVVATDTLAFVTLNSSIGSWCGQTTNVLQVYNIADLENPVRIDEVSLASPRGLAVDEQQRIVFVCDGGIKAYDITNPRDVEGLYTAAALPEVGRIDAYDCIVWKGTLIVTGADGIYQLGYDRRRFTFISKIDLRTEQ